MSQAPAPGPIEEAIAFFSRAPSREEIAEFRLSDGAQNYIRELLGKNSAGTLTREEDRELDKISVLNEVISLIRVRAQGGRSLSGESCEGESATPSARSFA